MYAYAYLDTTRALDVRCDGPRRPPVILSRRETVRAFIRDRERAYGHSPDDAIKRSFALSSIDDEIDRRALTRAEAHDALCLRDGALDDGSMSLAELQAALVALREQPTPGATP